VGAVTLTGCAGFRSLLLVGSFFFGLFGRIRWLGRIRDLADSARFSRRTLTAGRLLLALAPAAATPASFLVPFFRGSGLFLAIFDLDGFYFYLFLFFLLQLG